MSRFIIELPNPEYFRATPKLGLDSGARVDRENRVIHGATLIQKGPINDDRKVRVDDTTLKQVEQMVNEKEGGMKSRFGHPNMSDDGSPRKFLGVIKNARIEGDKALGDLHLHDSSFKSTNYGEQVLDLADDHPDQFGMSLAPKWDYEAMKKTKEEVDGEETEALRFKKLRAIDVVDEPAATRDGMFSAKDVSDLPDVATQLLNYFFPEASPDVIEERTGDFLKRYIRNRFGDPEMNDQILAETKEAITNLQGQYKTIIEKIEAGEKSEDFKKELASVTEGLASLTKTMDSLKAGGGSAGSDDPSRQASDEAAAALATSLCERASEITLACNLAGVPKLASDWILDEKLSINDVRKNILENQAKTNSGLGQQNNQEDENEKKDPVNEKLGKEYDKQKEEYEKLHLSREDYIATNRINLGLDELEVGKDHKEKAAAQV